MNSPAPPTPHAEHIGKYVLRERLGRGATAEVYKALHPTLGRPVAIKVLHRHLAETPDLVARFRREARAIAQLQHPHIVQVHDFDVDAGRPYMVMEYVAGPTLKARLDELYQRGERLPAGEVLKLFQALLSAVAYAHSQGMVHRDLKPANILLAPGDRPVLTDFGLARLLTAGRLSDNGVMVGTAAYMSPEQAQGQPTDHRSDLYALGVILFECWSGQAPFDADSSVGVLRKHVNAPIPAVRGSNPNLPPGADEFIRKALAKPREARFQSAGEMWAALQALAEAQPARPTPDAEGTWAASKPTTAATEGRPRRSRWRWPAQILVILLGLALGAGGVWLATRPSLAARTVAAGQSWLAHGDAQLAAEAFSEALAADPGNTAALAGRAQAYEALGRIDEALADVEAWISAAPAEAQPYAERARLSAQYGLYSDPAEVLDDLERAHELAKPDEQAHLYFLRGWAVLNFPLVGGAPNPKAALADLSAAVERAPADAEAQFTLALAYLRAGNANEALSPANRAIALGPDGATARTLRAHIQFTLGDVPAALDDLTAALDFDNGAEQRATLLAERAYLYLRLGNAESAAADVREAQRLSPQAALPGYVALLLTPGDPRPANAALREAQAQAADDPIWRAVFAALLSP